MYGEAKQQMASYSDLQQRQVDNRQSTLLEKFISGLDDMNKQNDNLFERLSNVSEKLSVSQNEKESAGAIPPPFPYQSAEGALRKIEMALIRYTELTDRKRRVIEKLENLL